MNDAATMAAFGASERACYEYPDDTEIARAQRAAFIAGAAWAAVEAKPEEYSATFLLSDD